MGAFDGKVAVVTGASRGIGAAIADQLGQAGATVVGTATTAAGAEQISARFTGNGSSGYGIALDVNDVDQLAGVVKTISAESGSPAILVNNAGITADQLLLRMKEEEWAAVIDTNLRSVYRLCKAFLRGMMKARYGRIINISSVVGSTGNPGQSNYAAAKAGMVAFSKSLAKEVGSRGITVNVVAPGFIETDMTDALSDEQKNTLLKDIPLQSLGQPGDIAAAVAFLAGSEAGYITGHTLHVNGGMFMN
jgi:3-oxoacyl-[acyl-carrier protein] reductase